VKNFKGSNPHGKLKKLSKNWQLSDLDGDLPSWLAIYLLEYSAVLLMKFSKSKFYSHLHLINSFSIARGKELLVFEENTNASLAVQKHTNTFSHMHLPCEMARRCHRLHVHVHIYGHFT
jgi:hypothetical protein